MIKSKGHIKRERFKLKQLSTRKMFTLLKESKGKCCYCGIKLDTDNITVEHKIPLVVGGTSSMNNLTLSCLCCNKRKGDMTHDEYLEKYKIGFMFTKVLNILFDFKSKKIHHN